MQIPRFGAQFNTEQVIAYDSDPAAVAETDQYREYIRWAEDYLKGIPDLRVRVNHGYTYHQSQKKPAFSDMVILSAPREYNAGTEVITRKKFLGRWESLEQFSDRWKRAAFAWAQKNNLPILEKSADEASDVPADNASANPVTPEPADEIDEDLIRSLAREFLSGPRKRASSPPSDPPQ